MALCKRLDCSAYGRHARASRSGNFEEGIYASCHAPTSNDLLLLLHTLLFLGMESVARKRTETRLGLWKAVFYFVPVINADNKLSVYINEGELSTVVDQISGLRLYYVPQEQTVYNFISSRLCCNRSLKDIAL